MTRPKPAIRKLHELANDELADFFVVLHDRTKGITREGKPYFLCHFGDLRRTVSYMAWSDGIRFTECEHEWHAGMFFKIRATFEDHKQYGPRIEIHNIRQANEGDRNDGFAEADLLLQSRYCSVEMFAELKQICAHEISNKTLADLVLGLFDEHCEKIKKLPASTRHYYPFPGGWLEHTIMVVKNCMELCDRYRKKYADLQPPLNRDLVIAAAALHEIGRVNELRTASGSEEPFEHTIPGKLFGHVLLGRDMVRDAIAHRGDIKQELAQLLLHLITTYPTPLEGGSPRLLLIPEILILHHADELDTRMEMFVRCLLQDASSGPFTERDPMLNRQLLKSREE